VNIKLELFKFYSQKGSIYWKIPPQPTPPPGGISADLIQGKKYKKRKRKSRKEKGKNWARKGKNGNERVK
jgi:hypothetical protein